MQSPKAIQLALASAFFLPLGLAANGAFSSWEQFNYQTNDNTTVVREYLAFHELDGFEDATGYTVAINGGSPLAIDRNPDYDDAYKNRISYATLGDLIAARPQGATYTHTITGGSNPGVVTIQAPDIAFGDGIPPVPVFTFGGVTGQWVVSGNNAIFYFDPINVTSFTVTLNSYAAAEHGDLFVQALFVSEIIGDGPERMGSLESEPEAYTGPVAPLTITFTKDLDPGSQTDSHYGFTSGSFYELEGEFVNVFNVKDGFDTDEEADLFSGFVYQNVTTVVFAALPAPIPEPPRLRC